MIIMTLMLMIKTKSKLNLLEINHKPKIHNKIKIKTRKLEIS